MLTESNFEVCVWFVVGLLFLKKQETCWRKISRQPSRFGRQCRTHWSTCKESKEIYSAIVVCLNMRQRTLQRGNSFPLTVYLIGFALGNHLSCTKGSKVLLFPSVSTDSNTETFSNCMQFTLPVGMLSPRRCSLISYPSSVLFWEVGRYIIPIHVVNEYV